MARPGRGILVSLAHSAFVDERGVRQHGSSWPFLLTVTRLDRGGFVKEFRGSSTDLDCELVGTWGCFVRISFQFWFICAIYIFAPPLGQKISIDSKRKQRASMQ